MKKQSLLLIGGAVLAFASCQPENTGGFTQEQVDSIVNVRVAEQMVALQASNDSTINVLAQIKADSIIAAMKGGAASRPSSSSTGRNTTVNNGGGTTKPTKPTGSVTDRKSSQENQENTSVTDRKSTGETKSNTSVTDRKSKNN